MFVGFAYYRSDKPSDDNWSSEIVNQSFPTSSAEIRVLEDYLKNSIGKLYGIPSTVAVTKVNIVSMIPTTAYPPTPSQPVATPYT